MRLTVDRSANAASLWLERHTHPGTLRPGPTVAGAPKGSAILTGVNPEGQLAQIELLGATSLVSDLGRLSQCVLLNPDADVAEWVFAEESRLHELALIGAGHTEGFEAWVSLVRGSHGHFEGLLFLDASQHLPIEALSEAVIIWPARRTLESGVLEALIGLVTGQDAAVLNPKVERWDSEKASTYTSFLVLAGTHDERGEPIREAVYLQGEAVGSSKEIATRLLRQLAS